MVINVHYRVHTSHQLHKLKYSVSLHSLSGQPSTTGSNSNLKWTSQYLHPWKMYTDSTELLSSARVQRSTGGGGGGGGVSPNSPSNPTTQRCDGLQQHVRLKPVDWVHVYRPSAGSTVRSSPERREAGELMSKQGDRHRWANGEAETWPHKPYDARLQGEYMKRKKINLCIDVVARQCKCNAFNHYSVIHF